MNTTLKVNRQYETIKVEEEGKAVYEWTVSTDDENIERMLSMIGNAIDRAHVLVSDEMKAETDEERRKANDKIVRLQKRVISAVIGVEGYNDILAYIGGDTGPADPTKNIRNVGDIFAALCVWVYERCTAKQLRETGVYFEQEQTRIGGRWVPDNRAAKRAKGKKSK